MAAVELATTTSAAVASPIQVRRRRINWTRVARCPGAVVASFFSSCGQISTGTGGVGISAAMRESSRISASLVEHSGQPSRCSLTAVRRLGASSPSWKADKYCRAVAQSMLGFPSEVKEMLLQPGPCAIEARGHSSLGNLQGFRQLSVSKSFDFAK